ncbi:acetolactate synthase, large subunit, biosynthetic type [Desulfosporosinus orientis DSM 765]|uniref:Acetolactate synthase n=1 Tax=Desulfosporosinus orientis (strain ATCC 19365 / DSM 765 / NCIMB 8382 / VKM B-1628 / Singapore I) TaxID=768706 RepID=G7WH14_DESOD|nr:biosynthetic-type acetolactate synthase large subunit [Desulfosporosinus orientis]AET69028.1 acetolactate synthase, large subunit, biosynthetic type [Desulfosporosinus orientis DSM 765]
MSEEKTGLVGATILLNALQEEGVDVIFGYPGGVLLPLYNALLDSSIRHILTRHEQGAVFAADGYSRVTGKVGVCLGTSGPGATNLVTGIANAFLDSIPLVVLTGQVPTGSIGSDSFQEVDIIGITMPITKHSYLVKDARDLPRIVREAFYLARTGRPGPVLIDLPKDVLAAEDVIPFSNEMKLKGYKAFGQGKNGKIEEVVKALSESSKPVLYAGGGVVTAGAEEVLRQFVDKTSIPVVTTLMGIGSLSLEHPNSLGMVGMHGTVTANYAVDDCDLLIAVGVRFDDRVTSGIGNRFATKAKVIHIDIDPAEVRKVVKTDIQIIGDARQVLTEIMEVLPGFSAPRVEEWWKQLHDWKKNHTLDYDKNRLTPQVVIQTLGEVAGGDTIVTTDVGQHQMWAAQYYPAVDPRNYATSCGLGVMGYGVPSAVGAQIARPGEPVLVITGDGSFQMSIQELGTIAQNQLPIKIILLNNGVLGMVRQMQKMFYDGRYNQISLQGNPDFVKVAEGYGIHGIRVNALEELRSAFEEAFKHPGPVLVEIPISEDENVLPMVPPGKLITEMIVR